MGSRQRHLRPRQPRERALILYRPVGLEELRLVYESDLKAFPPRLAEQPIFYPVLNEPYATQIARDWNTKSSNAAGYVTQFEVDDAFVQRYEVQQVGAREHVELWVPAEELSRFNEHIVPPIRVISAYFGEAFHGLIPTVGGFAGRNAVEQFVMLDALLEHARFDFWYEVAVNQAAVFLHFPFWAQRDFSAEGITAGRRAHVLSAITERWSDGFAERPLPQCRPGPPGRRDVREGGAPSNSISSDEELFRSGRRNQPRAGPREGLINASRPADAGQRTHSLGATE